MSMLTRKTLFFASLATVLAACSLGVPILVSTQTGAAYEGILDIDNEVDIVYVAHAVGDANQLLAIRAATGDVVGETWPSGGEWRIRAVSADPDNDSVWVLIENGYLIQYGPAFTSVVGWDQPIGADFGTLVQTCDFVKVPGGWFATSIIEDGGLYYAQFSSHYDGEVDPLWAPLPISWTGTVASACPRVAFDMDDETYSILLQNTGNGDHLLRMDTWTDALGRHWEMLDDVILETQLAYDRDYNDVAVGFGYTVLAASPEPAILQLGRVDVYKSDSFPGSNWLPETSRQLGWASAVAVPNSYERTATYPTHFWWSGQWYSPPFQTDETDIGVMSVHL